MNFKIDTRKTIIISAEELSTKIAELKANGETILRISEKIDNE